MRDERIDRRRDHHPGRMSLSHLCLVTAVEIEFKTAVGLLDESGFSDESQMNVCRGRCGNRRITVLKSEMGAIGFAERLGDHLKNNRYDALIVAGLAGALSPQLKRGDAVVLDLCHDARTKSAFREKSSACEEKASIACDDNLSKYLAETLRASGAPCFGGTGLTVDQIITRAKDKISLGIQYNAMAVDMETYDLLTVCAEFGLPAAAVRVVSDEADCDLPDFNQALKPDGQLSNWQMALAMLKNPIISIRFLLGIKPVIDALRANLRAIISA